MQLARPIMFQARKTIIDGLLRFGLSSAFLVLLLTKILHANPYDGEYKLSFQWPEGTSFTCKQVNWAKKKWLVTGHKFQKAMLVNSYDIGARGGVPISVKVAGNIRDNGNFCLKRDKSDKACILDGKFLSRDKAEARLNINVSEHAFALGGYVPPIKCKGKITINRQLSEFAKKQRVLDAQAKLKAQMEAKAEAETKRKIDEARRQAAEAEEKRKAALENKRKAEKERKAEEARRKAEAAAKKRKAEEARLREVEAERKRKAAEAARDRARYEAASKKSRQLLEDTQDFLKVNPGTTNLMEVSAAVIKLAKALKAKKGGEVEVAFSGLSAIAEKSELFTGHLEKLAAARQERERETIAKKVVSLKRYKGQISKFIAANLVSNIETAQKLMPLVKTIDDILAKPDLSGVLAVEAQVEKMISATPAFKGSIAKAKAQRIAKEEAQRQAELARKHAEEEKRRQEKLAAERAEEVKRLAELARKHAEEEKRRQEKLAAKRAEEKRRQAELVRKQAEEEKRRQEKLQNQKELMEKEKATFDGKLLFTITKAEEHFVEDIEKDDTGKVVSVDIQVGCSYQLKITNYLTSTAFVNRFQLQSDAIEKSAEQVFSFVQLEAKIPPGDTLTVEPRFIIAKWLDQSRKNIPTEQQRGELLKKHGCASHQGSVYLAYDSAKSFLRVAKIRRLSKRKLQKLVAGNPQGIAPLLIQN